MVIWALFVSFADDSYKPCVTYIFGFTSAFLFSLETQHTIGYGNRYVTEECPEAVFILALQSITGVFIQAFMVGIVFAKLSRPKKRAQTLLFSRNAVVCHRDGVPCLMFRVGDMRKSHIIEAHVTAQIIRRRVGCCGWGYALRSVTNCFFCVDHQRGRDFAVLSAKYGGQLRWRGRSVDVHLADNRRTQN